MLFAAAGSTPADAQVWGQPGQQPPQAQKEPPKRPNTYKMAPHAFDTTTLSAAPTLAYVPNWTGVKPYFVQGYFYNKQMPIESYTLIWQYKETAPVVVNWYTEALQGAGWRMMQEQCRENVIVARHTKENADLTLQVAPAGKTGYRCSVEMRYSKGPNYKKR